MTPLLRVRVFLRSTGGAGHRYTLVDDEVAWVRMTVLVALHSAARVALTIERVDVALLFVRASSFSLFSPTNHGSGVPDRG